MAPLLLALVDGNALLHRAYHALPELMTTKGEMTNAVYGFATMVFKALDDLKADHIAVCFDLAAPTFRHEAFAAYKAQRPETDQGLVPQFARTRELLAALSIPIFELEGYEADDLLGTLSLQAHEQGIPCIIVTGDNDALQLVSPRVRVLVPRRGITDTVLYDEEQVRERFGVPPGGLPDYKALVGDPSDNLPGVPGVGAKTAGKLLQTYGSVEDLYAHLDELPAKQRDTLRAHVDQVRETKRLATIVRDAPITLDLDACRVGQYDRDRVVALLRELEFRTLLDRLPRPAVVVGVAAPDGPAVPAERGDGEVGRLSSQLPLFAERRPEEGASEGALGTYELVATAEKLDELARALRAAERFSFDTETTGQDPLRDELIGIALAWRPGHGVYVPVRHSPAAADGHALMPLEAVRAALGPLLADAARPKIAHHAKFDIEAVAGVGMAVDGVAFDTMLAAQLLESTQRSANLKDLAWSELGLEMTPISALIGSGKQQRSMADVALDAVAQYAAADADVTLRLAGDLEPKLHRDGLGRLFAEIEMPLVPVLVRMETVGIALDVAQLQQLSAELHAKIGDLAQAIYEDVGHRFNLNSTQQLADVLFKELSLPGGRRTKTGYSTDAATLEELRGTHPIIEKLLEHRQLVKLKSTYVDALPTMLNPRTGRLHTSFSQIGAATGRLSSSNPNLQNIPVRTEIGRRIRRAFVAGGPDMLLLAADYTQVELRLLAHFSRDERLLAAFAAGEDVHRATAAEVFGVPPEAVTSDQRRIAKVVNFGIIYGVSDFGLAQNTGLPRADAARIISQYMARYEGVRRYIDETLRQARARGYVTTLFGRRRYLPEIAAPVATVRNAAERVAMNAPIQGTAADIVKLAMIRLDAALAERGMRSRMLLQVHDELLLEVPHDELDVARHLAPAIMAGAGAGLSVPLEVDVAVGPNWDEMS
ncbi:MAG: DNA polymerase I [Chloroflexi bacterium]|nr:DNA polymerase I [Chloroflexota bacterium]